MFRAGRTLDHPGCFPPCPSKRRSSGGPDLFPCPDSGGIAVATLRGVRWRRCLICHPHDKESFHGEEPNP